MIHTCIQWKKFWGYIPHFPTVQHRYSRVCTLRLLCCVNSTLVYHPRLVQIDNSGLGARLDRLIFRRMNNRVQASSEAEYEVEDIIGIKPHPRMKRTFLYLTTFKGCVIAKGCISFHKPCNLNMQSVHLTLELISRDLCVNSICC
jgi:hypothetical protein